MKDLVAYKCNAIFGTALYCRSSKFRKPYWNKCFLRLEKALEF